ncbi:uncharacterized protein B0I36DRAFT_24671 [Microdochium trichocladiopsis]|uniref:Uncharacterized protein n=1 Tax=Microdochium trichocladiopsis TaxID=1682393 RepID=A0A9P8YKF1_9PEZI|nr:uncharacterized protein B0I36DRAFT_24671 [Microdochium trichocladiopsis]KAH7041587.1 hypothetical protein B0I36DRAFT_24671 [Microdochium trichocladiopsis]
MTCGGSGERRLGQRTTGRQEKKTGPTLCHGHEWAERGYKDCGMSQVRGGGPRQSVAPLNVRVTASPTWIAATWVVRSSTGRGLGGGGLAAGRTVYELRDGVGNGGGMGSGVVANDDTRRKGYMRIWKRYLLHLIVCMLCLVRVQVLGRYGTNLPLLHGLGRGRATRVSNRSCKVCNARNHPAVREGEALKASVVHETGGTTKAARVM